MVVDPELHERIPLASGEPELRVGIDAGGHRIAALRASENLPAVEWTDPTLVAGVTPVKRAHLTELRIALGEVYDAVGRPRPTCADAVITVGVTAIEAAHIMELRDAVLVLESAGTAP